MTIARRSGPPAGLCGTTRLVIEGSSSRVPVHVVGLDDNDANRVARGRPGYLVWHATTQAPNSEPGAVKKVLHCGDRQLTRDVRVQSGGPERARSWSRARCDRDARDHRRCTYEVDTAKEPVGAAVGSGSEKHSVVALSGHVTTKRDPPQARHREGSPVQVAQRAPLLSGRRIESIDRAVAEVAYQQERPKAAQVRRS